MQAGLSMDIARAQEPLSIHHLGYFASLLLLEIDDRCHLVLGPDLRHA
jgi:hypothetical protein